MTPEAMGYKIIADGIRDFNARLHAAPMVEERAAILRVPVWIAQAQEDQEYEIDATDDMDWQDMADIFAD